MPPPPPAFTPLHLPPFPLSLFSMVSPSDLLSLWVLSLSPLSVFLWSLSSVRRSPWRPPLREFDFPSCLALPPWLRFLLLPPSPSEASLVPPRRWAIIPGSNEERLFLRGVLTDTSPTHLSTNQTAGVGDHIELRVVVGKLRLRRIAASLSLTPSFFFTILLHSLLSISATSLSLTGCHSFQLSLLLCQPSIRSDVFVFLSRQEKSDFQ